jgi:hypothetical protein
MKKILFSILMVLGSIPVAIAQSDKDENPLQISGYLEAYYVYDFGNPSDHNRPDFLYSFNRHNEVSLNFGFIQAAYENGKVRGKLALMTGTYANANLAAEPGVLKNIFEANVGVKLSKSKDLWVDAGVFGSHIGFESAIGALTWNMTRSILAENSPYFLSGAKISYTSDNQKWFLSGLILNGWQRIQRVEGNQTPAFGHQVTWTPTEKITLNSSSFIGSDTPDIDRRMRYFHNFFGQFQFSSQFGLIAGFDIGAQQTAKESSDYDVWYSPVMIARFTPADKLAFAARAEYYSDKGEVIISTGTPNGFETFGYSVNMDVQVSENVLWRVEGRSFASRNDFIFLNRDEIPSQNNFFLGTSLSIMF